MVYTIMLQIQEERRETWYTRSCSKSKRRGGRHGIHDHAPNPRGEEGDMVYTIMLQIQEERRETWYTRSCSKSKRRGGGHGIHDHAPNPRGEEGDMVYTIMLYMQCARIIIEAILYNLL